VKWGVRRDSLDGNLRDFLDWMKAVKKSTVHHVRMCLMYISVCESQWFWLATGSILIVRGGFTIILISFSDY